MDNLRYGENPHQKAAFYVSPNPPEGSIALGKTSWKELSFNNINDGNAAIDIVKSLMSLLWQLSMQIHVV